MGQPGGQRTPSGRIARRIVPAGLAFLIGAFGLPQILESVASAAGSGRSPLLAPPGAPPGPIPAEDRMPVLAVGDENGVRHPKQVPIALPRDVPPDRAVAGTTRLSSLGGPNLMLNCGLLLPNTSVWIGLKKASNSRGNRCADGKRGRLEDKVSGCCLF